ncbi:hypothetical protein K9K85_02810 [Patescibacteria group bacterium]|nr:hypothetical protein [Patescibacteria group bacterium]
MIYNNFESGGTPFENQENVLSSEGQLLVKEIQQKKQEGVLSLESVSQGEQKEEELLQKFADQDPRVRIIRASQKLGRMIVENPERF